MLRKPTTIILSVLITLLLVIATVFAVTYNKALKLNHEVDENYTAISVVIENRIDKFVELLNALNNAEEHVERQLDKITEARKSLGKKENLNDITSDIELAISETIVLLEDNPNTYVATNLYNNYMGEISATINMITNLKLLYNGSVTNYNLYIKKFPNVLLLKLFNFNEKELYDPNLVQWK